MTKPKILVSACLAGICCRYDGKSSPNEKVIQLVKEGRAIPICPEQLGGLPTPMPATERVGNQILTKEGKDLTEEFQKGAEEVLKLALSTGCKMAILKSKSPSCGKNKIYDGTFQGKLVKRNGILTDLLINNGISVVTEDEL